MNLNIHKYSECDPALSFKGYYIKGCTNVESESVAWCMGKESLVPTHNKGDRWFVCDTDTIPPRMGINSRGEYMRCKDFYLDGPNDNNETFAVWGCSARLQDGVLKGDLQCELENGERGLCVDEFSLTPTEDPQVPGRLIAALPPTVPPSECANTWSYNGFTYMGCTNTGFTNGAWWCVLKNERAGAPMPTEKGVRSNHLWGLCDLAQPQTFHGALANGTIVPCEQFYQAGHQFGSKVEMGVSGCLAALNSQGDPLGPHMCIAQGSDTLIRCVQSAENSVGWADDEGVAFAQTILPSDCEPSYEIDAGYLIQGCSNYGTAGVPWCYKRDDDDRRTRRHDPVSAICEVNKMPQYYGVSSSGETLPCSTMTNIGPTSEGKYFTVYGCYQTSEDADANSQDFHCKSSAGETLRCLKLEDSPAVQSSSLVWEPESSWTTTSSLGVGVAAVATIVVVIALVINWRSRNQVGYTATAKSDPNESELAVVGENDKLFERNSDTIFDSERETEE
ncbi:hypothetical protein BJ742DRAFT_487588 [Cladochytrium replicatum]|nr:hypothetical protein BJ742DRAFT_487588 [Cladochytrium replicatum]